MKLSLLLETTLDDIEKLYHQWVKAAHVLYHYIKFRKLKNNVIDVGYKDIAQNFQIFLTEKGISATRIGGGKLEIHLDEAI